MDWSARGTRRNDEWPRADRGSVTNYVATTGRFDLLKLLFNLAIMTQQHQTKIFRSRAQKIAHTILNSDPSVLRWRARLIASNEGVGYQSIVQVGYIAEFTGSLEAFSPSDPSDSCPMFDVQNPEVYKTAPQTWVTY